MTWSRGLELDRNRKSEVALLIPPTGGAIRYNVFHSLRIPYKKLTAQRLADAINSALSPDAKVAAAKLGQAIKQEV